MVKAPLDDRGTALLAAVLALLVLGLLTASLVLLGDLEARATAALRLESRAEALAVAGLEHAASVLGPAGGEPCGFTRWSAAAGVGTCGSPLGRQVLASVPLGGGQYAAYLDNDCAPLVETPGQDPACTGAVAGRDDNDSGVLTAVGMAGGAQARARALVVVDHPWEHVCATARTDSGGWCGPSSGTVGLAPSDPGSRNGPWRPAGLPRPVLGCSRVDPGLHAHPGDTPAAQASACAAWAGMYQPPYPPHQGAGTPRFVVAGADPLSTPGAQACDGGGQRYFGHFDCALTTPCPASVCGGAVRRACVRPGDTRAAGSPGAYVETVAGACPVMAGVRQTGLVFAGDAAWSGVTLGSPGAPVGAYVLGGRLALQGGQVHGTVVVEGTGGTGDCATPGLALAGGARVIAAPPVAGSHYGGPLAVLVYDPVETPPGPDGPGQDRCFRIGPADLQGLAYSAGAVQFDGGTVTGSVVAWRALVTGAGTVRHAPGGTAKWVPGFAPRAGSEVRLLRRTLARCERSADDAAFPGPCV